MPDVTAHPRLLRRQAVIWSIILPGAALLGWFGLPEMIRVQFSELQLATLIFFILIMLGIIWALALGYVHGDAEGVTFRNGFRTHHLPWSEVESIRYRPGDHWPFVDLADSDLPMIGIQRSDGPLADTDVAGLRALLDASRGPAE